jgi:glycosyltransferase involved in cell wall biosynthesis
MSKITVVSLIVPCFNQAEYLSETLQSVLSQTHSDWECIIVNDGSYDSTDEIVAHWLIKDKRFKYIYQINKGVSEARNVGIKSSTGKYILPLDADDLIESTYLEKAVNILENNARIGIVYCKARFFGKKKGNWYIPSHSVKRILFYNTIFSSAVFRRSDYDTTKGFNTNMKEGYEDWDFWLYFVERGVKVYKIPETLFFYRIRDNSRNQSLNFEKLAELSRQIILNHFELYRKHFKNPYILSEYFEFRQVLSVNPFKSIIHILRNLEFRILIFFLESKLYYYFKS